MSRKIFLGLVGALPPGGAKRRGTRKKGRRRRLAGGVKGGRRGGREGTSHDFTFPDGRGRKKEEKYNSGNFETFFFAPDHRKVRTTTNRRSLCSSLSLKTLFLAFPFLRASHGTRLALDRFPEKRSQDPSFEWRSDLQTEDSFFLGFCDRVMREAIVRSVSRGKEKSGASPSGMCVCVRRTERRTDGRAWEIMPRRNRIRKKNKLPPCIFFGSMLLPLPTVVLQCILCFPIQKKIV